MADWETPWWVVAGFVAIILVPLTIILALRPSAESEVRRLFHDRGFDQMIDVRGCSEAKDPERSVFDWYDCELDASRRLQLAGQLIPAGRSLHCFAVDEGVRYISPGACFG